MREQIGCVCWAGLGLNSQGVASQIDKKLEFCLSGVQRQYFRFETCGLSAPKLELSGCIH